MKKRNAVVFVFYNQATKKFLMEERASERFFAGTRIFPGGEVENHEKKDFSKALVRESLEEFGVRL